MSFGYLIINWYRKNKRDLPWRKTADPYKIWVSEVILQQTRVEQGMSYYHNFTRLFPDAGSLANAPEDAVMKAWQGLGYYSRARHMHEAARKIRDEYGQGFPSTYEELLKMKGIGEYTAAAVSSIAFGEPRPVVDGNVMRVVARYAGIGSAVNTALGKKQIIDFLRSRIDPESPGDFNQAVMELGALICVPRNPRCRDCPVSADCFARIHGKIPELPVLVKAKSTVVIHLNYLVLNQKQDNQTFTFIKKRTGSGIWKNLYDFPLIETVQEIGPEKLSQHEDFVLLMEGSRFSPPREVFSFRHLLSHRELKVKFFTFDVDNFSCKTVLKVPPEELCNYPVPRPIEKFIKKNSDRPGIFSENPD